MRDPNRIDVILGEIEEILKTDSALTLGKLIILIGGDPAAYYTEDHEFVTKICAKLNITINTIKLTDPNLLKISNVWKKIPDLRLGQLICNITGDSEFLDKVSDENLAIIIEQYYSLN